MTNATGNKKPKVKIVRITAATRQQKSVIKLTITCGIKNVDLLCISDILKKKARKESGRDRKIPKMLLVPFA